MLRKTKVLVGFASLSLILRFKSAWRLKMYNPYARYTEQSIMTMTSGEMLVRLYEETAKQIKTGIAAINSNDVTGANASLKKAQTILKYLTITLDRRFPIAETLSDLYDFFNRQITEGNTRMDVKPLEDVLPMVEELRETFAEGEKIVRRQQQQIPQSQPPLSLASSG